MATLFKVKKLTRADKQQRFRRGMMIVGLVVLIVGVGVGGYFAYRHFFVDSSEIERTETGDPKEAATSRETVVEEYDKLVDQHIANKQEHLAALYGRANSFEMSGDDNSAIEAYKEIIQEYPEEAPIYMALGRVYQRQDKKSDAIAAYTQAIEHATTDAQKASYTETLRALEAV